MVHAATGIPRAEYNSHQALVALRRCGFETSAVPRGGDGSARPRPAEMPQGAPEPERLRQALEAAVGFLTDESVTTRIGWLEAEFEGADWAGAAGYADVSGLSVDLVHAVLLVRRHTGRIDDLIHTAVITSVLPLILEGGSGSRGTRRSHRATIRHDS